MKQVDSDMVLKVIKYGVNLLLYYNVNFNKTVMSVLCAVYLSKF